MFHCSSSSSPALYRVHPPVAHGQSSSSSLCVMGADDFSDVKDALTRELLVGFVDQLRLGKPSSVISVVMKSRIPNQPQLWHRVLKAAGNAPPPKHSPASAAVESSKGKDKRREKEKSAKKKEKDKERETDREADEASEQEVDRERRRERKRDKKEGKKRRKEEEESLLDETNPAISLAPHSPSSPDTVASASPQSASRRKQKGGRADKHARNTSTDSTASSPSTPGSPSPYYQSSSLPKPSARITSSDSLLSVTASERRRIEKAAKVAEREREEERRREEERERQRLRRMQRDPNEQLYGKGPTVEEEGGCCCVVC